VDATCGGHREEIEAVDDAGRQVSVRASEGSSALIVTVGTRACAIPLQHVAETMRPLAIEPISGTPEFVRGVSMIRGAPIPVVDLEMLFENAGHNAAYGRFVTLKVGERRVALAVDRVVGLRKLDSAQIGELPPLLRDVGADLIESIGTSDAQLLIVLRATRLVPDAVWATLEPLAMGLAMGPAMGTEAR